MGERYTIGIKELPTTERPRERLMHFGPHALSVGELLAIVLRTGTRDRSAIGLAELLMSEHGGLKGVANASIEELGKTHGVGPVKAIQIAACVELGKRLAAFTDENVVMIRTPDDALRILMPELRYARKECFKALLLDTRNRVIRNVTVSVGTLDSSLVHPREVFQPAVAASAAAVLVAHNHPSGDPAPSPEDRAVTRRLAEAGKLLGIELVDHLIIGDGRWVSLKEQGVL